MGSRTKHYRLRDLIALATTCGDPINNKQMLFHFVLFLTWFLVLFFNTVSSLSLVH